MANEPYGVMYPVAFHAGGDTTRDAFRKHIKEIEEIYAKLNSLNSDKLDSTTLTDTMKAHIDDTNPHPNYKPPIPDMDMIPGNLEGWRVTGTLNNANIPSSKVTGLEQYVKGLLPSDKGEGITASSLKDEGSITFKNGLIVKWGYVEGIFSSGKSGEYEFPTPFPSECFVTTLTYKRANVSSGNFDDTWVQLSSFDAAGFKCTRQADDTHTGGSSSAGVTYIAIGK